MSGQQQQSTVPKAAGAPKMPTMPSNAGRSALPLHPNRRTDATANGGRTPVFVYEGPPIPPASAAAPKAGRAPARPRK